MDDRELAARIGRSATYDIDAAGAFVAEVSATAERDRRFDRHERDFRADCAKADATAQRLDDRATIARAVGKHDAADVFCARRDGFQAANVARAWSRLSSLAEEQSLTEVASIAKSRVSIMNREATRQFDVAARAERDHKIAWEIAAVPLRASTMSNGLTADDNDDFRAVSRPSQAALQASAQARGQGAIIS